MRVLIVGDSPALPTGVGRMIRELAPPLVADGIEVLVAGWGHAHAPESPLPYHVIPVLKSRPDMLENILLTQQPDTVLTCGDPSDFAWLAQQRAKGAPWRLFGWLNIEQLHWLPALSEVILDAYDGIRATSEHGARLIGRPGVSAVRLGVDTGVFYPHQGERTTFMGQPRAGRVCVFVNAQNTHRKNLPTVLAGIREAMDAGVNILAGFNTELSSPLGYDLTEYLIRYDLLGGEAVVFTGNQGVNKLMPEPVMAQWYREADALLVGALAEGFCLPVLEAFASKTLVLAPDGTALSELLGPKGDLGTHARGFGIFPGGQLPGDRGGWVMVPSPTGIAAALLELDRCLAEQPDRLQQIRAAAYQFAREHPWKRAYEGIAAMLMQPPVARWPEPRGRVATGEPIDLSVRLKARVEARSGHRLAVVKLGGLGDALMATPVIRALAEQYGAQIDVYANHFTEVYDQLPEVASIITLRDADAAVVIRSLADEYDLCADLRGFGRLLGRQSPVASPMAGTFRWMAESGVFGLQRAHTFDRHMTTMVLLGLLNAARDIRPIFTPRAPMLVPEGALVVAPGTGPIGRLKQPEQGWWTNLVWELRDRPVIQVGDKDEALIKGDHVIDNRGLSLAATATLLEQADQVIAVESGLAHLARAVRSDGAPTIVLFGPTHPISYGYPEHVNLSRPLCPPCFMGPLWHVQECAMAAHVCLNLPPLDHVLAKIAPPVALPEAAPSPSEEVSA